ncbi:MAG: flavin reductase family protein [Candidatus Eisenbacteria bacterium]|nr:flavin reductase family protein [Candidatus Eisenbacteria bacterium]
MERQEIPPDGLRLRSLQVWDGQWFLLTAGDFDRDRYNTMTVAWGSLGTMWNRPFAQVVVRPTRHTYGFIEEFDTFTLCAFGEAQREALKLLGTRSGRDGDKIRASGLTPVAAQRVAAPGFAEAELIIECRKIYWDDFDPRHFLEPAIERCYPEQDYHRIYYGEIVAVSGLSGYRA